MTDTPDTDPRPTVGWLVVGPMESVCIEEAPTPEAARGLFEGRWIADVWPIHEGDHAAMDEVRCCSCGKLLAG